MLDGHVECMEGRRMPNMAMSYVEVGRMGRGNLRKCFPYKNRNSLEVKPTLLSK